MKWIPTAALSLFLMLFYACDNNKPEVFEEKEVYRSDSLIIKQVAEHSYQHISYLKTAAFGLVACNGMMAVNGNDAIVFDSPTGNYASQLLIDWINNELKKSIKAVVPTHFHEDCLGGLMAFHKAGVPSYASFKTIDLAKQVGVTVPMNGFEREKKILIGNGFVDISYFGEGHTRDNTVAYFPKDQVLFGGCLIKEEGASKGFLGDANVKDWAKTVKLVKQRYPQVQLVIPGHGNSGGQALLDYTIELFSK